MATADLVKALIRSHLDQDDTQFYSVAMQLAAHEARTGHGQLAVELREMIDRAKTRGKGMHFGGAVPIGRPRGELATLLEVSEPSSKLSHMVLDDTAVAQLARIVKEQRLHARIREHGLTPRRKLLLVGPPGTGKTMTAEALAGELGLPLFLVRLDALITKFMGETAAKLRQVFDAIADVRGVYFFDEFDAIGSQRGATNDVGEIRRILNSFLQMLERDKSHSLIIAATNHPEILDYALYRRFDAVIDYHLPTPVQIAHLLKVKLGTYAPKRFPLTGIAGKANGLSFAEVARAADEAIKEAIMHERDHVAEGDLLHTLAERHQLGKPKNYNKGMNANHARTRQR